MSKKTFIVFGLLVLFLAVLIPWLAFRSDGDAERGAQEVPADLKSGQSLFQTNCGTCHALYAAGTDGNYGPDLDELLAPAGPPEGRPRIDDQADRRPRPQRGRKRRRQHHHAGPDAGRHPQRGAGEGSRRIRRPHRRRGLEPGAASSALAGALITPGDLAPDASASGAAYLSVGVLVHETQGAEYAGVV